MNDQIIAKTPWKDFMGGVPMHLEDPEGSMFDALKEAFYIHASWANYAFFNRIEKRYKREYFNGLRKVFLPIKSDPDFKYTYFSPIDREFVNTFLRNTWLRYRAREIYHRIKGE